MTTLTCLSKISKLLRTPEKVMARLTKKMEKISNQTQVVEKICQENNELVQSRLKTLGLSDEIKAQDVYNALLNKAKESDKIIYNFFHKLELSKEAGCRSLVNMVKEITGNLKGFFLKEDKAKEILKLNPPKNIMAALGYGTDIDKMIEKEDIFELFCALRFIEDSYWLNNVFFKPYENLTKDDFEEREIKMMVLSERWLKIGEEFLGKKLHHMSHLKELGVVFIIPIENELSGDTIYLFFMNLHYVYEVDWHSRLFKKYSQEFAGDLFAKKIINALRVEVTGDPLPDSNKISWRIVPKYLAKADTNDPRLSEPHISPEAWHFKRALRTIEKFSQRFPELSLDFWAGLDVVGDYFPHNHSGKSVLISFDLFDNGISLLQKAGFESKYLYHQQEALWNKLFTEYMGEETLDRMMMENLDRGMIVL